MIKREIKIGEQLVSFRASAAVPRLYRNKFKRDIFKDLLKMEKSYNDKKEDNSEVPFDDLEPIENMAYIMAFHADNSIPADINDWLGQFGPLDIYEAIPQLMELWGDNMIADVQAKKRLAGANGK